MGFGSQHHRKLGVCTHLKPQHWGRRQKIQEEFKVILCYIEFQASLLQKPKKTIFQMNEPLEAVRTSSRSKCRAPNGYGLTRKQARRDLPRSSVGLEMAFTQPLIHVILFP